MSQPISACIMTKNEQDNIGACIDSVKPYVKEIIIIDTGSEDDTVKIATSKNVRVYQMEWKNDFSIIRNEMIKIATQPIILMVDADERVLPNQEESFRDTCNLLLDDSNKIGKVTILNEQENKETVKSSISRIFRNSSSFSYVGAIHEQIQSESSNTTYFQSGITLAHEGYLISNLVAKDKYERNLSLLFNELKNARNGSYINFQIGRTYYVMGENKKAIDYLKKVYREEQLNQPYYSTVIQIYGWALLKEKKYSELFNLLQRGIELYPDYTDLYYLFGCTLIEMKSAEYVYLIPETFQTCIELGEPDSNKYETVEGVGSFKARYNLGLYYELTHQIDKAVVEYRLSASDNFKLATARLEKIILA
ncbi:glycosyltransferase [Paenibacillus chitinolyticus]|uniref:glycosyltransferase n=1 Tax=Paenibacillus chitinolyticus TaxID=79263 RepID=UPI003D07C2B2